MKKILFPAFLAAALIFTPAWARSSQPALAPAPVNRLIKHCGSAITEVNISALRQSAEALKSSRPDLSAELHKLADELLA